MGLSWIPPFNPINPPPLSNVTSKDVAIFEQLTPLQDWTIDHGLKTYPDITVVDLNRDEVIGYGVNYVTDDSVVLTFGTPFAGYAYLNY